MRRIALLVLAALTLGGCQTLAGAIAGAARDVESGIDMAHRMSDQPRPE